MGNWEYLTETRPNMQVDVHITERNIIQGHNSKGRYWYLLCFAWSRGDPTHHRNGQSPGSTNCSTLAAIGRQVDNYLLTDLLVRTAKSNPFLSNKKVSAIALPETKGVFV